MFATPDSESMIPVAALLSPIAEYDWLGSESSLSSSGDASEPSIVAEMHYEVEVSTPPPSRPLAEPKQAAALRRSTRNREPKPVFPVATEPVGPPPAVPRLPRKQTFEMVRAPRDLIEAFRVARTEYHEMVFYCWFRMGKTRDDKPTKDDMAALRNEPEVRAAAKKLDQADAELNALAEVVKHTTITRDWAMHQKLEHQEAALNQEYREKLLNQPEATSANENDEHKVEGIDSSKTGRRKKRKTH